MPPQSSDLDLTPPSPLQVTVADKGSTTPLPLSTKEEQVQKEISQEEELQQTSTNEVSEERHMVEYPQQTSQDVEV